MNRRRASSSFSIPEPKRQDLSLNIVVDDLHDLLNDVGPLSPLTPLEDSSDELSSDEEILPSSKWCRQAEGSWMLPGEDEDDLKGILWKST
jgi:hypothetical protein